MSDVGRHFPPDPRRHPEAAELVVDADLVVNLIAGTAGETRTRLRTTATVPHVALDEVDELLEPLRWGRLSAGRITMTRVDGSGDDLVDDTPTTYQETFTATSSLRLRPVLVCHRRTLRGDAGHRARALEYRLSAGPPESAAGEGADRAGCDEVHTDQGSIVLHETGAGLLIRTTKRVRFLPPFDGPGLTLFAGSLGYTEAFEGMVTAALARVARDRQGGARGAGSAGERGGP